MYTPGLFVSPVQYTTSYLVYTPGLFFSPQLFGPQLIIPGREGYKLGQLAGTGEFQGKVGGECALGRFGKLNIYDIYLGKVVS